MSRYHAASRIATDLGAMRMDWIEDDTDSVTAVAERLDWDLPADEAIPLALEGATVYRGFGIGEGEDWAAAFSHGSTPGGSSHSLMRSTAIDFALGRGYMQGGAGDRPVVVRTTVRPEDVDGGETAVRWSGLADTPTKELSEALYDGTTAYDEVEVVLRKLPASRYELEWAAPPPARTGGRRLASAPPQDWYARRLWRDGEKAPGAQVCWRAEATLPDGRTWRDSGDGPCPDAIRVPRGAADILVVTDDGRPAGPRIVGAARWASLDEILYHGSKAEFSTFRPSVSSVRGLGIFLSDSRRYAEAFGDIVYTCRVRLDNPKTYATSSDFVADEMRSGGNAEGLTRGLAEDGFDGVVIERSKVSTGTVREVIAFDPASVTQLAADGDAR